MFGTELSFVRSSKKNPPEVVEPVSVIDGTPSLATSAQPLILTVSGPVFLSSIHSSLAEIEVPIHAISLIITAPNAAYGRKIIKQPSATKNHFICEKSSAKDN